MGKLDGRIALVTGGQRGIGAAIVRDFAAEGAICYINYPSEKEAPEAAAFVEQIMQTGKSVIAIRSSVAIESEVNALVKTILAQRGRLDILVNNAGVNTMRTWEDMDREAWDRTMSVNLTGVYQCCKAVLETMKAQNSGNIINIASIAPYVGRGNVDYISAKSALIGLTRSLAKQYGKNGIRANAISPGFHDTDMVRRSLEVASVDPDEFIKATPLGYLPGPEGIGKAALFLASDDASFITGHNLVVDGGLTLR
jgi:3-oxoacyl-[acyl-carrier protein] reductase